VGDIGTRFQGLRILRKTILRCSRQIYCCSTYQQTYQYFFHDRSLNLIWFQVRYGLLRFSAPIVVRGPCPG